jgi:hypothetical protein
MKMKSVRILAASALMLTLTHASLKSSAQGGCIEISAILVDACGSPEGENEMVRFNVGSTALNTSNMVVDWPNNSWQGLCQDAGTAAVVSAINQSIQGCGLLTEPSGGVLPANAKVLLLTSTNINTGANSFSNINDTLIVLFQCAGNTSGHFANYNVLPGLRTLSIEFTGTGGCVDSVTYDRTLLVNQYGAIGGFTFENDGAVVEFTSSGTPSYVNYGCQALGTVLSVSAGPDIGLCPGGATVANLVGNVSGTSSGLQWAGGTGTFNNPTGLNTTYTPGPGETGIVYITLTASGACNSTRTDTARVNIVQSLPVPSINVNGNLLSSSITDSTYFYNWYLNGTVIPFQFGTTYTAAANGCYQLILSTIGGCTSPSDTVCLTNVGIAETADEPSFIPMASPGENPWLLIESASDAGIAKIIITDISGRVVMSSEKNIVRGTTEIRPDWSGVANGLYIISVTGESSRSATVISLSRQ